MQTPPLLRVSKENLVVGAILIAALAIGGTFFFRKTEHQPTPTQATQKAAADAKTAADAADTAAVSARKAADSTKETAESADKSAQDASNSAKDAAKSAKPESK